MLFHVKNKIIMAQTYAALL